MNNQKKDEEIKKIKAHIKVFWEGGIKTSSIIRGFEVSTDSPKWKYGTNSAPAPGELFLASIGSCFTSTFTKCAQEMGVILDDVNTDVKGEMSHEMNGKERILGIELVLHAFAQNKFKEDLKRCFEKSKIRCPLISAVSCEIEIAYEFKGE